MKKTLTGLAAICFALLPTLKTTAQNPCGTELSDQQIEWLLDYAQHKTDITHKSSAKYYVPLFIHFVGETTGKSYYGAHQMMLDICQLNQQYAPAGFYFYLAGTDYIANSSYFDHEYSAGYAMMQQNNKPNVANVYIVLNPAGNCGYYSPQRNGVAIGKSCMGTGATTMAHELGHFFSLPHPFDNVLGTKEYVNGSNCTIGGDLFCDTRADFLNTRWACPYTGTQKDPLGDPYNPDETLYMSYSSDRCAFRFSNEQMSAMEYNINTKRTNLKGSAQDTMPATQKVTIAWPPKDMAVKPDQLTFRWNSVPNAKFYVIQASHLSVFPGNLPVDIITTDTFITASGLLNNRTYSWRVRPIYPGRTCTEFSDVSTFVTSSTAGISSIDASKGFTLYPNPSANAEQVYLAFENGLPYAATATIVSIDGKSMELPLARQNDNLYLLDIATLQAGFYFVTVTNGNEVYRQKLLVE